jgi:hypothetical protein
MASRDVRRKDSTRTRVVKRVRRRRVQREQAEMFKIGDLQIPRRIITYVDEGGAYRSGLFQSETMNRQFVFVKMGTEMVQVPRDKIVKDYGEDTPKLPPSKQEDRADEKG